MKKFIVFFCLFIFFFHFFQIIYSQRALFVQNYDIEYWKDRFEHSQWALPLSKRIIGDDGLFAYIGFNLINGGSITGFDSEVPPLGKYLIGLSIKIFNNPFYYSIFFGLGSLALFYIIGVKILSDKVKSLYATSILFLDPLFFSQFWRSMLDICQLFFLLLNALCIILVIDSKRINKRGIFFLSILSGISLGLFAQVKYPMLIPIIFLLETIVFFIKKFKILYLLFLISFFVSILIININFFLNGGTIIDFLKYQKYIFSFYTSSQLNVHNGAIWSTFFLGKFPEINGGKVFNVEEWSIMWSLTGILAIPVIVNEILKKRSKVWKGFAFFILFSFLIYSLLPIYPRYLLLVLPFIYLFVAKVFLKFNLKVFNIFFVIILLYGLFNSRTVLRDNPDKILNNFYYNFSHQYFQDIYQENINKFSITRDSFRLISQGVMNEAGIKFIKIRELKKIFDDAKGSVKIKIEYFTQDLGSFSETKELALSKNNGKWKINWNWNLILNGFLPGFNVETERILGRRGSITNLNKVLVQDEDGYLISVNPEKIDRKRENEMLQLISSLSGIEVAYLQNAYLENSLPGEYVPLITSFKSLDRETVLKLSSFKGIKISEYPSRIYFGIDQSTIGNTVYKECCTRIYSKNYHGILGLEEKFDLMLSGNDGGKIIIKDRNGKIIKVVVEKEVKIGDNNEVSL